MTIAITPHPELDPPRNTITLTLPASNVMTTVVLYRDDPTGKVEVREQPNAGLNQRVVDDYECPYGTATTYSWSATYTPPGVVSFTETWANLSAWTTSGGGWSVSSGTLIWTGADSTVATVTNALAAGKYHCVFSAPVKGLGSINFGGFTIDIVNSRLIVGASSIAFSPGVGAWTIDVTDTTVSLTTTVGSYSLTASGVHISTIQFVGAVHIPGWAATITPAGGTATYTGLAVAAVSGNVYVADSANSLVRKFDNTGAPVLTFGGVGSANGKFGGGAGNIALDSSENVYVVDAGNSRIQKFNSSGVYQSQFATSNSANAIAVDSAGNSYVLDVSLNLVRKYNSSGTAGITWTAVTVGTFPQAIAVDASNNVYVADKFGYLIKKTSNTGTAITSWGTQGTGNGQFNNPCGIAINSAGDIYVVDQQNENVQKFSNTGTYIGQFGSAGIGNGQFTIASWIGVDNAGNVSVVDRGRYQKFATTIATTVPGVVVSTYGTPMSLTETSDPVTLAAEDMWLIHPAVPGLSVSLSLDDLDLNNVANIGDVTLPSRSTRHDILGQKKPISVSSSPRGSDNVTFQIAIEDAAQEAAIRALIADQTPILFQVPPDWDLGFASDFYDVGDVTIGRQVQVYAEDSRILTMPLVAVESPIVTVTPDVLWTWADVLATYSTWDQVKLAYNTWADLFADNRNPGF